MNRDLALCSEAGRVVLVAIREADCEDLRRWKNANRTAFFYKEIIAPEQQALWFRGYRERPKDYVFIVQSEGKRIGCMGFRLLDGTADIYNVILGEVDMGGRGLMSESLQLMCAFIAAHFTKDIRALVLVSNPALQWYCRNGFHVNATNDTYHEIRLDTSHFRPPTFTAPGWGMDDETQSPEPDSGAEPRRLNARNG